MARTTTNSARTKPAASASLVLRVLASRQISPHFQRVTLGGGDLDRFRPMGHDQWFRLFLPVAGNSLDKVPDKLDTISYLRLLAVGRASRPIIRNYTVREHRPGELDVDFALHEPAGPATGWASSCVPGDPVAIIDEGVGFARPADADRICLVGEESALPAIAGILASLPEEVRGHAVIEVPAADDRRDLRAPAGVEVTWLTRDDHTARPGAAALAAASRLPVPATGFYGWAAGEQALAAGMRRHWVAAGVPRSAVTFCGYWRAGR